jgi:Tfp pilus assembly protein PilX
MPTDHQINEQRPSRAQRQGGMLITGLIVLLILAFGIWWLVS